mgnify:CR=1 FL=1
MTVQGPGTHLEEIEIIKVAREAATLHGKEWILRQLRGERMEQPDAEQPIGSGENEKRND